MLWLAGFLGIMAVGSVTMIDFDATDAENDIDDSAQDVPMPFILSADMLAPSDPNDAAASDADDPDELFSQSASVDADQDYYEDEHEDDTLLASPVDVRADTAEILSVDPEQDGLLVVWDDATGIPPEISLAENSDDPSLTDIVSDDSTLSHVRSEDGLTADDISLVPLSTAQLFGWAA